jgi:hypothetical protein
MRRAAWRFLAIGFIALSVGVAGAAAVLAYIPDTGSAPSIFDDFNFSSTANGFWHVNADGASDRIARGTLKLSGNSIELDRRLQTDPKETVVVIKVRAHRFQKFGFGLGIYHSGTIGMEFDPDGIKCGRGTDHGYSVDILQSWRHPPVDRWFYLEMTLLNPYPDQKVLDRLGDIDPDKLKKVGFTCAAYDQSGRLLNAIAVKSPPPNTHYVALDEAYIRTWDGGNDYQVDWFYAGPPQGNPLPAVIRTAR